MGSVVILDMLGGAALLLWGLHMVQSGIIRAFGPNLRRALAGALGNRFAAFAAGLGLTALLQSSTATGLMTASFATEGMVSLVPALAIMLGANVGTTLIVQVLSFNIAAVAPVLFIIGLVSFRVGSQTLFKDLGRVSIGAGLMLLALHILIDSLAPAEHAPAVGVVLHAITGDPVLCIVIAGLLTWALHSSVATVLLVMSLAFSNFITPAAALALVVGANLGSAINPVFEGTKRTDRTSYRLPLGNLLNRLAGVILITPFLPVIADALRTVQPDMAKMTALFHIGFNVALALVFLPLLDPLAKLLIKLLPASAQAEDPSAPKYLEVNALETPSLALTDAARETLRMGDVVETMLQKVMTAMMTGDRSLIAEVSRMDNVVDGLDEAIKLYVTRLTRGTLDERESRRAMEIISFTINLEHIGDIIDKNLSELATKKIKRGLQFLRRGRHRAERLPQGRAGKPPHGLRRVHVRRRRRCAPAGGGEGPPARRRASSPPSGIWSACARAVRKRWRPPACTSTSCATRGAFTRMSAATAYLGAGSGGRVEGRGGRRSAFDAHAEAGRSLAAMACIAIQEPPRS